MAPWLWLAALAVLLALPAVLSGYAVPIFILIFFYGFLGQAWNIVGGYTGQLSVGHAAFVGIGGYPAAMLSIEAGVTMGWERYVADGLRFGIDRFGASGPAPQVYEHFGLTAAAIAPQILERLKEL